MQEQSFTFIFKEFDQHVRSAWWYVIAGVLVAAAVLYSFATNNFLFTVIIVLAIVILFSRQFQSPAEVECEITASGIRVGTKHYAYADLAYFSIIEREDGERILYIHEARGLRNLLPIPLIDIPSEAVRMFLLQFLEEDADHRYEPVWDWLMRALRL